MIEELKNTKQTSSDEFTLQMSGVNRHLLTWDHSMATHWGQAKVLQICRVMGRGEWVHFHSSTWENCPWESSSTHSTLRSCQPPPSPQDTEHWVQGPCSQLHTHRTGAKLTWWCVLTFIFILTDLYVINMGRSCYRGRVAEPGGPIRSLGTLRRTLQIKQGPTPLVSKRV